MARPINELAQRIDRVVNETTYKLEIMTLLNEEFFTEIREKKDEATLTNHFGGPLGRLLWRHAWVENKYNEA